MDGLARGSTTMPRCSSHAVTGGPRLLELYSGRADRGFDLDAVSALSQRCSKNADGRSSGPLCRPERIVHDLRPLLLATGF